MYQACLLTPFYFGVTKTLRGPAGPDLDSPHMRTEMPYADPTMGTGASETAMPEGLRKLGRLAVWAVAGAQFVDLIWRDADEGSRPDRPVVSSRGARLSDAELADLIRRATRAA